MRFDLVEATLNYLNGTRLFEMAQSVKDSRRSVGALSHHITEHLVKILYFGSSHRDYNHWCGEVNGAFFKYKFKTFNNKYPTAKQYESWFFDGDYDVDVDYIEALKSLIRSDYNHEPKYIAEEMLESVKFIMRRCFESLSSGKHPDINKFLKN